MYTVAEFFLSLARLTKQKKKFICIFVIIFKNKGKIQTLIDVGAHRGESIKFLIFSIVKICFGLNWN